MKILYFLIMFILVSCDFTFENAKKDSAEVNKAAEAITFTFRDDETFTNAKNDITFTKVLSSFPDVIIDWSTSNKNVLLITNNKLIVQRTSEIQEVFLYATIKKNKAEKNLKWKIIIPPVAFIVPNIEELIKYDSTDSPQSVTGQITLTTKTELREKHGNYSKLNVSYETDKSSILNIDNNKASLQKDKQTNTSYYASITATITSDDFPGEEAKKSVKLRFPAKLKTGSEIKKTVTVQGKELKLTYFDDFDDEEQLYKDWDVGNPGVKRPQIGNEGNHEDATNGVNRNVENDTIADFRNVQYPEERKWDDGFQGYHHDRYKQVNWSPMAVKIKDGKLEIQSFWKKGFQNKGGQISGRTTQVNENEGYALEGAIHSKRMFPRGYFIAKINLKKTQFTHWDAFWGETNNGFSNKYGYKRLYISPAAQAAIDAGTPQVRKEFKYRFFNSKDDNRDALNTWRGENGQQLYEYDIFEGVGGGNGQYNGVIHTFYWYGGHPGNTSGLLQDSGYFWTSPLEYDNAKPNEYRYLNFQFDKINNNNWGYFILYITDTGFAFHLKDEAGNSITQEKTYSYALIDGNSTPHVSKMRNVELNPIQIKFSAETGQWGKNHNAMYNNGSPILTETNPDIMYVDYFAFYAWNDEDRDTWYTVKF